MHRLPALLALLLLTACGQQGPLYDPDEGVAIEPQASPAAPATTPGAATGTGVGGPTTTPAAPTAPASPDRSDEARKRVPQPPTRTESR